MGETLTAKERSAVSERLQAAVHRMGSITQENVVQLTKLTALRDELERSGALARGVRPSEVVWGWIAVQQRRGFLLGVERMLQTGAVPRPAWREVTMAKTGMDRMLRQTFTNAELDMVTVAGMVLAHARRAAGQRRGAETWHLEGSCTRGRVELTQQTLKDMKQSTKAMCSSEEATKLLCVWEQVGLVGGYLGKGLQMQQARAWAKGVVAKWQDFGVLKWPGLQAGGHTWSGGGAEITVRKVDENSRQTRKRRQSLAEESERVQQPTKGRRKLGHTTEDTVQAEQAAQSQLQSRPSKQAQGDWRMQIELADALQRVKAEWRRLRELGGGVPIRFATGTGGRTRVLVCVDLFAGTQSLRPVAASKGWVYIALDREKMMWSPTMGSWVVNSYRDLSKGTTRQLWDEIQRLTYEAKGVPASAEVWIAYIWASMDCTTYSPLDSMQSDPYRQWGEQGKGDPVQGTDKGMEAAGADAMMNKVLDFMAWARRKFKAHWGIENPHGTLRGRQFMDTAALQRRGLAHNLHLLNWCCWLHLYCKPSDVWTSILDWEPQGTTGDGKCGHRCQMGREVRGGFSHFWAIGQESFRLYRGMDKDEVKMMVPGGLHEEALRCID